MSGNPAFFDFFRIALRNQIAAHSRATLHPAGSEAVAKYAAELVAEATSLGYCDDITEADRNDVVARVCAYSVARQQRHPKQTPTASNRALWAFACSRSRKIALASARRHGGRPDREDLENEIRAIVAAYRARPGLDAHDDDADGIVRRLVEYRATWTPSRKSLASDRNSRPGASAAARRALADTVRDLVENTSGPDPRLYVGLHRDRPSRTLGIGKAKRLTPRRPTTLQPSTRAVHSVLADRAESQKRRPPSHSAVARAVRSTFGAPDREARLACLSTTAHRIYEILSGVLPGNRISAFRLVDLVERIWGPSNNPSTQRGHRKRCIEALGALTAARIDINAISIGDVVVVGRSRRIPADIDASLKSLPLRDLPAAQIALKTKVWSTPEGKIAASYLRIMAREAQADDYDELSIFLGNPRLVYVRALLRRDPSSADDPFALLEEAQRVARFILHQPTVAESKRGKVVEVGSPEHVEFAQDLIDVLDAACDGFIVGWKALVSEYNLYPERIAELGEFIAKVNNPEEWRCLVTGEHPEASVENRRRRKNAPLLNRPPSR